MRHARMQYMIYWLQKSWQFLFDKLELYSSTALHCTCSCFCSSWADVIFCLLPPWPPTFLPPTQLTNPLLPGKGYTLLPLLLPRQPHLPGRITRPIFNMTSLILLLFQFCMHVLATNLRLQFLLFGGFQSACGEEDKIVWEDKIVCSCRMVLDSADTDWVFAICTKTCATP